MPITLERPEVEAEPLQPASPLPLETTEPAAALGKRRVWTITKLDEHSYIGTADDVIGEATGTAYGNALHWRYVLALDVDGKTYNVDFDDWMYLIDEEIMLNRSEMRKFGFRLGDVTLSFRKKG